MKQFLNEFYEFLDSEDENNHRIAFIMISKSVNLKNLSLRDLLSLNIELSSKQTSYSKEKANFYGRINKYTNKYSRKQIWDTYHALKNEENKIN